MIYVGWCYIHGDGTEKDITLGLRWYDKAASTGDVDAQIRLGEIYEIGNIVPRDCERARRYYSMALESDSYKGPYACALSAYFGSKCFPADLQLAISMFDLAAERGHLVSMFQSARILRSGAVGKGKVLFGYLKTVRAFALTVVSICFRRTDVSLWDWQRWVRKECTVTVIT